MQTCLLAHQTRRRASNRQRGVALVAVLWIGVLAGLVLLTVQQTTHVNTALSHSELATVQARWLARAGIEQAIATLQDDDLSSDSAVDWWYDDPASFEEIELATGTFSVIAPSDSYTPDDTPRYGIIDLSGRIHINHAEQAQLNQLEDLLDQNQVAAILDWRDGDETARPGGAERGYYQRLPFDYQIRNGPFLTLHELKLVRDIDDETFYNEDTNLNGLLDPNEDDGLASPPDDNSDGQLDLGLAGMVTVHAYTPNVDSYGTARINVNEADAATLQQEFLFSEALAEAVIEERGNDEFDSLMDLLDIEAEGQGRGGRSSQDESTVNEITPRWLADNFDRLTLTDDEKLYGRININTASRDVLMTLPDMTRSAVDGIIAHRESARGPYTSVGELLNTAGISEDLFEEIAERVTVRSNVFQVTSVGTTHTGIRRRITAVIDRGADPVRLVDWHEGQ